MNIRLNNKFMNRWYIILGRILFYVYFFSFILFFLLLRQGYPIVALPWAGHDDALFFRAIDRIARGDWLGDFDNRTLAKGPFIGIFGAIGIGPRIWFKTLEALLYACAMLVFSLVALRMGVQKFLILFGVLLLSLNPHLWSGPGNRLIRDVLYSAQAVIFIGLVVYSLTRTHQRSELVKLGFATGVVAGMAYLTREEDIWFLPALAVIAAMSGMNAVFRGALAAFAKSSFLYLVVAITGFFLAVAPVLILNKINYGQAIVSELRTPEFKSAIGALMRVGDHHPSRYVPVSQESMQIVFSASEAGRSLQPGWEMVRKGWGEAGATSLGTDPSEVAGGWFVWAIRDAVSIAGHYASANTALLFYKRLAEEINEACDSGRIKCRGRRDTLAPELATADLPDLFKSMATALLFVVKLGDSKVELQINEGDPLGFRQWSRRIGRVVLPEQGDYIVRLGSNNPASGLNVISESDSSLQILSVSTAAKKRNINSKSNNDEFDYEHRLYIDCKKNSCFGRMEIDGVTSDRIDFITFSKGDEITVKGLSFQFLEFVSLKKFFPDLSAFEKSKLFFLGFAVKIYAIISPFLFSMASLGFVFSLSRILKKRDIDPVFILGIACLSMVFGRCLIIAYIDITSWKAINNAYLGPAFPFMTIYIVCGLSLLIDFIKNSMMKFRLQNAF